MLQECIDKHNLPSKEELESEHGKLSFEENDDIINELVSELRNRVGKFTSLIEQLLQPESDMVQLLEANQFTEKDREWLYAVFTTLEAKRRSFHIVYLSPTPEALAKYYNELFALWREKKIDVKRIITQALNGWNKTELQNSESYLG